MKAQRVIILAVGAVLVVACDRGAEQPAVSEPAALAPLAISDVDAAPALDEMGAVARADTPCAPGPIPPERVAGSLTVRNPPDADTRTIALRLRSHSSGALSMGKARTWVGPPVPAFVPLLEDDAELALLEEDNGAVIAFYRDPYGAPSCNLSEPTNCNFFVRAWDECGKLLWARRLNDAMSRPDRLEVQDLRIDRGVVYFNEACQSYSKEAGGKCSALVALDPLAGEVLWRTSNLVSNGVFLVHGDYLITGYGFTAEPDYLHIVRRSDGEVVHRMKIASGHESLRIEEDAVLTITRYHDKQEQFLLEGFDGAAPKLVRAPTAK